MGVEAHLLHTCTIERATSQPNALHEDVPTWVAWAEDVPCRLVMQQQRQFIDAIAEYAVTSGYKLLLPHGYGAEVAEGDRVTQVVYEDGTEAPGAFVVRSILPRRARCERHVTLQLERYS